MIILCWRIRCLWEHFGGYFDGFSPPPKAPSCMHDWFAWLGEVDSPTLICLICLVCLYVLKLWILVIRIVAMKWFLWYCFCVILSLYEIGSDFWIKLGHAQLFLNYLEICALCWKLFMILLGFVDSNNIDSQIRK